MFASHTHGVTRTGHRCSALYLDAVSPNSPNREIEISPKSRTLAGAQGFWCVKSVACSAAASCLASVLHEVATSRLRDRGQHLGRRLACLVARREGPEGGRPPHHQGQRPTGKHIQPGPPWLPAHARGVAVGGRSSSSSVLPAGLQGCVVLRAMAAAPFAQPS